MLLTVIIFIITLFILVVSHELGHFLAAKKFGIKVLEFGFGIPPRIFGKQWGETMVSLNWLPIGGFVKLFGEDEVDKKVLEDKRSFAAKPVLQRMTVVVAGVAMNLLLAVLIFWVVLAAQGFQTKIPLLTPYQFIGVNQTTESTVFIGAVAEDSPAAEAGVQSGDRIVAINGKKIENLDQMVAFIRENAGESLQFTLINPQEETRSLGMTPRKNPPEGQGALGVELGSIAMANLNYETPGQKLASGITHSYNLSSYSIVILGQLISSSLEKKDLEPVSHSVAGPVGITNMAGAILKTQSPLIPYLNFMALLSLNLAIINILPFPALDGGRLFFLSIEAIFRRKIKAEVERFIHTLGMALLIALIILITFSDIKKFF